MSIMSAASPGHSTKTLADVGSNAVILNVGANNANTTYSGTLSGPGGLVKNGTGTLYLSGSNTYSGGTTLSSGVLEFGSGANGAGNTTVVGGVITSGPLGTGTLTLLGGTLENSGSSSVLANAIVASGTISFFNRGLPFFLVLV